MGIWNGTRKKQSQQKKDQFLKKLRNLCYLIYEIVDTRFCYGEVRFIRLVDYFSTSVNRRKNRYCIHQQTY